MLNKPEKGGFFAGCGKGGGMHFGAFPIKLCLSTTI